MTKNPLLFILDSNNDFLRYIGTVKGLNEYAEKIVVISPQPKLNTFLSASIMSKNANGNKFTQYILATAEKPSDYISVSDPLYQTVVSWNVYAVDMDEKARAEVNAFRSVAVSFSFAFEQVNTSIKCVTYKGVFGVDNPLPTEDQEIGDFYECEDLIYTLESGSHIYAFSIGMFVYWNGTRWVKDRLQVLGSTTSVELPVEPSFAVGGEFDDDETIVLENIAPQVMQNTEDIEDLQQKTDDMLDGTRAFDEITLVDESNNQTSITYASKIADDLELDRLETDKADITYVDAQDDALDARIDASNVRITQAEADIDAIELHTGVIDGRLDDLEENDIVIEQDISNLEDGTTVIPTYELKANKGVANGYVPLGDNTKIPSEFIPNSFDDVLEFATYADMLAYPDKRTNTLYIVIADETTGNDHSVYRWSGSVFVLIHDEMSASEIKTLYESNANTNAFTDAEKSKLGAFETADKYYNKNYIDSLKDQNGWESELLTLTPLEDTDTILTATLLAYDSLKLQVRNTATDFVDTDIVETSIGIVTGYKIQLSDTSVYLEIGATNSTFTAPSGWELQIVGLKYTELKAVDTSYDNTDSELEADNVQEAIDEVVEIVEALDNELSGRLDTVDGEVVKVKRDVIEHEVRLDNVEGALRKQDSTVANVDDDGIGILHMGKDVAETPITVKVDGLLLDTPQLVTNGDFSNGTTGFASLNTEFFTVTNGIASFGAFNANSSIAPFGDVNNNYFDNKYIYFAVYMRATTSNVTHIQISNTATANIRAVIENPVLNQWYLLSNVLNLGNTIVGNYRIYARGNTDTQRNADVDFVYAFNVQELKTNKQYSPLFNTTFDLMTDAEIKIQMDTWVQEGTLPNDIMAVDMDKKITSVGKNLFDGEKSLGLINTTNGTTDTSTATYYTGYIPIKPNTTYIRTTSAVSNRYAFYDKYKVFISGAIAQSFTSPSNAVYVRYNYGVNELNQQLEQGSTATNYEPYRSTSMYLQSGKAGYQLPNTVKDTIEFRNGKAYYVQRVKSKELVLADVNFSMITTYTDIDYLRITKPSDYIGLGVFSSNNLILEGKILGISSLDGAVNIGRYTTTALPNQIIVGYAKGTLLATAQADLIGRNIYYQLATPIETEISVIGNAFAYSRGTFYIEDMVRRNGVYNAGFTVNKAILTMGDLFKLNADGSSTKISTSSGLTVAGDGLSFTHSSLANGDYIWFDYKYRGTNVKGLTTVYYYDDKLIVTDSVTSTVYRLVPTIASGVLTWTIVAI
jgi:hypothetical protein